MPTPQVSPSANVSPAVGALAAAASDDVTAGRWTAGQAARELGETLVAAFVRAR